MSVAQLKAGALFAGRFRIERVIGRGGMGAVYSVVEELTGERVALKILAPQLVSDPSHRTRFAKEASISSGIQSTHIVPIIAAGVDDATDTPWILMELLLGDSLAAFVRTHGRLDVKHAADVLGQVAEALEAAHKAGVIHRDLKPDNVFVVRTPDGSLDVRVLDFGIAKLTSDTIGRTTGAMGSPLWMAPEETKKEQLTPAVDVWAFGLLAFYVLTGREIWRSADGDSTIAQALSEVLLDPIPNPILRAHSLGATLPKGFEAWFAGCVVRDVSVRFQSVREAWTQLQNILLAPREVATPPTQIAAPLAPSPSISTSRLIAIVAGVAAAIVLIVAVRGAMGRSSAATDGGVTDARSATASSSDLFAPMTDSAPQPVPLFGNVDPVLAAVQSCLDKNDLTCARAELERALAIGGASSPYYAQFLYDLCELQNATSCMLNVRRQYPGVNRDSHRTRMLAVQNDSPDASVEETVSPGDRKRTDQVMKDATRLLADAERSLLEPKVMTGKATREEAQNLYNICEKQGDRACCSGIRKLYPKVGTH